MSCDAVKDFVRASAVLDGTAADAIDRLTSNRRSTVVRVILNRSSAYVSQRLRRFLQKRVTLAMQSLDQLRRLRAIVIAGFALLVSVACGDDEAPPDQAAGDRLSAVVASYDLAVGPATRFMVGIFNEERGQVGFGSVEMSFLSFGTSPKSGDQAEQGPVAVGSYLPLPGAEEPPVDLDTPAYLESSERGVYQAEVAFPQAGFWKVQVAVDLDGKTHRAEAAFAVLPDHAVPMPGDPAIPSENPTAAATGVNPLVIDSRAADGAPIPDPELHGVTVKRALADGKPILLAITTPTFCQSRFCGPITDMVAELAEEYDDRAAFIHFEVWENFAASKLNPWAAEWIAQGKATNEPWVFLVGADGKITHRWDNVAARSDIEPLLQDLPVIAG